METVEQTIRTRLSSFKRDLLGFADLIAFPTGSDKRGQILLVQVTSGSNHAARRTKIAAEPRVAFARLADCTIEIHSWRKSAAGEWVVKREDVS